MVNGTISDEIARTFEIVSLRQAAKLIKDPQAWADLIDLTQRCQAARFAEEKLYADRYETRVEEARRRLIDEAGSKAVEFKPWWGGSDRFNSDDIQRQAHREVQQKHFGRLGRIDEFERQQLRTIVQPSDPDGPSGAREPFLRAASRQRRQSSE
jgi:hypothetical protein